MAKKITADELTHFLRELSMAADVLSKSINKKKYSPKEQRMISDAAAEAIEATEHFLKMREILGEAGILSVEKE